MKRFLFALVIAAIVLMIAAPAYASRDPFQPIVQPGSQTGTTTATTGQTVVNAQNPLAPPNENMPNTGSPLGSWLPAALMLGLAGSFLVLGARHPFARTS